MIRKAIGLGLLILVLKFLMKEVFAAGETTLVSMLNSATAIFSKAGSFSAPDSSLLVPR